LKTRLLAQRKPFGLAQGEQGAQGKSQKFEIEAETAKEKA
jgi:hypothetical protein